VKARYLSSYLFLLIMIFLSAAGCARKNSDHAAELTITISPVSNSGVSNLIAELNANFSKKTGYDLYISTQNNFQGEYIELKRGGVPVFDFVEVPESDSYAVAFYDLKTLPAEDIAKIKRVFQENFLEIKILSDGSVQKVKLVMPFEESVS
jgi:predicted HAD superfamily phosphohydrolase